MGKRRKVASRSWFDMRSRDWIDPAFGDSPTGYFHMLRAYEDKDDPRFDEYETIIFSHVLEHEVADGERRGALAGPLKVSLDNRNPISLLRRRKPLNIPPWVENDGLRFVECSAQGILLVERYCQLEYLMKAGIHRKLDLILATGSGVPRVKVRRLLHRLSVEQSLPTYVLTDNDTWGYFIYSVMKRGMLSPYMSNRYLASPEVRYIGLKADDGWANGTSAAIRKWKEHWTLRLGCLREYPCFRKKAWQSELERFERVHQAIDLIPLLDSIAPRDFARALEQRLAERSWIE